MTHRDVSTGSPGAADTPATPPREVRLSDLEVGRLFAALFEPDELKVFTRGLLVPEGLIGSILWNQAKNALVDDVAIALGNRGRIDTTLFRALIAARPAQAELITEVAHRIGIPTVEWSLTAETPAPRLTYRPTNAWQMAVTSLSLASLSRWSVPGYVLIGAAVTGSLVWAAGNGGVVVVGGAVVASMAFALLVFLLLSWAYARITIRQLGEHHDRPVVLVAASDGFEIRASAGASLTPYALVKVRRGRWWYVVELGAATDYFYHRNADGDLEGFWQAVSARTNPAEGV